MAGVAGVVCPARAWTRRTAFSAERALAGFGAGLARERGIIVFQRWSRYAACRNTSRSWLRTHYMALRPEERPGVAGRRSPLAYMRSGLVRLQD